MHSLNSPELLETGLTTRPTAAEIIRDALNDDAPDGTNGATKQYSAREALADALATNQ